VDKKELEARAIHFANEAIKYDPQSTVDSVYIQLDYRDKAIFNYRLAIESFVKLIQLHILDDLNSSYKQHIDDYQKRIKILEKIDVEGDNQ
jgi:hypothetical protein